MKKLYLDTEFNGFGGELISLALAPESASGKNFYEVLPAPNKWNPWVEEHVVPYLQKPPVTPIMFRQKLRGYIQSRQPVEILADWPADFQYLLSTMLGDTFESAWIADVRMTLLTHSDPKPLIPHNALSDAIALRDWHLSELRRIDVERGAIFE